MIPKLELDVINVHHDINIFKALLIKHILKKFLVEDYRFPICKVYIKIIYNNFNFEITTVIKDRKQQSIFNDFSILNLEYHLYKELSKIIFNDILYILTHD